MTMLYAEKVRVECDERGFELHLLDSEGDWHVFNVQEVAESLHERVKLAIGPWLDERNAARDEFKAGKGDHAYCPAEDGACYHGLDHKCPGVELQRWPGETAIDYYNRTGDSEAIWEQIDTIKKAYREAF